MIGTIMKSNIRNSLFLVTNRAFRVSFFVYCVCACIIVEIGSNKFVEDSIRIFTMANNVSTMKNVLRHDIKKTLSSMSIEEKLSQSNYVTDKLLQHRKYSMATRVGIYLSLPDEIRTDRILKHMFSVGKICFVPRYNSESMEMVRLNSYEEKNSLPKTRWNISQPAENQDRENALHTGGLDILIVPGRAFTKTGCRLGRGKGYYDRYLLAYDQRKHGEAAPASPYTIGLAFAQQIVDELPQTSEDIKLNEVIYAYADP